MYVQRAQKLPLAGTETFFLWGPRQTGKSTLLRHTYENAVWIDLLKAEEYRRYLQQPELLRQELADEGRDRQIVIDEIQKVPALLDEAHWLLENLDRVDLTAKADELSLGDLVDADEIWLSNAVIGVRRVGRVDDRQRRDGPRFSRLSSLGIPAPGW